jgi:hypothetical protein
MSEWINLSTRPFLYDRSDFRALAVLGRPRVVGWLFNLAWALFALLAVLIGWCVLAGSRSVLPYAAVAVLLLALFVLLHRLGADLGAWALEKAARRDGLLREQVLTASHDVFRAESTRGKTEVRWSAIPWIVEGDGRLFVYSTSRLAFIIPRRAFGSDAEFGAFAAAAEERWRAHHRL